MPKWLTERFSVYREVVWTRTMAIAQGTAALIGNLDKLAGWVSGQQQTQVIPRFPWYVWAIGALFVGFVVALEKVLELERQRTPRLTLRLDPVVHEEPFGNQRYHHLYRVILENQSDSAIARARVVFEAIHPERRIVVGRLQITNTRGEVRERESIDLAPRGQERADLVFENVGDERTGYHIVLAIGTRAENVLRPDEPRSVLLLRGEADNSSPTWLVVSIGFDGERLAVEQLAAGPSRFALPLRVDAA